ncbi:hypothetical protein DXG01_004349 [Tephrocybe rancida]|nr:hypothetical protein DXG01_004349 [Tephrocybe rancida]
MQELIKESQQDLFDAVIALNRLDGGISLFLHCPGFEVLHEISMEDLTVDVLFSPQEYGEGRKALSKFIALVVQGFARSVVLPYLAQFAHRCSEEMMLPPQAPAAGESLKTSGMSYLPPPEVKGGTHICCCCRAGNVSDLIQDIFLEEGDLSVAKTNYYVSPPFNHNLSPSIDPAFLIAVQTTSQQQNSTVAPPAASKQPICNTYRGVLVSLGPHTDAIINSYHLCNWDIIPAICALSCFKRNSSWARHLQAGKFNLSHERAHNLSKAMHDDLGIPYADVCHIPVASRLFSFLMHPTASVGEEKLIFLFIPVAIIHATSYNPLQYRHGRFATLHPGPRSAMIATDKDHKEEQLID